MHDQEDQYLHVQYPKEENFRQEIRQQINEEKIYGLVRRLTIAYDIQLDIMELCHDRYQDPWSAVSGILEEKQVSGEAL